MARQIDPPRTSFDKLLTPLTAGERRAIDLFDARLPIEWEIYIQPHLNGLRPDLVLLNPQAGIAVFEVKDWDFDAMEYSVAIDPLTGQPRLMARNSSGKRFSRDNQNPVDQIRLYAREILDLYCPRLDGQSGLAAITAGLIFTKSSNDRIEQLLAPFRARDKGIVNYPQYYPLAGAEDIATGNLDRIFPGWKRRSSRVMTEAAADDLRGWLKEPAFSREQRLPLPLDSRQRELATTRTETGYRRIKGPAGSGKSVVLAARAAELAGEGKHVLVVTFNITLLNYLRDLSVRHVTSRDVIRKQIDFLNFHMWCKRVCMGAGHEGDYNALWRPSFDGDEIQNEQALQENLAGLVQRLYDSPSTADMMPSYDAILVDEGQDYRPNWWQTLRRALKPSGEMLLAADKTQNIYATAQAWTEQAMTNAGFPGGRWAELRSSYRLPPAIIPLLASFASTFLRGGEVDIPELERRETQWKLEDLFPVELRWVHVHSPERAVHVRWCVEEVRRQMTRIRPDTAIPDITFLSGHVVGREVVDELERRNVGVLHTFDPDRRKARRQKRAFFQGSATIKATTLHSFKGWEARHLVLFVSSTDLAKDGALLYTAMTRLRRHEHGSALTVVSCCGDLLGFGREWPEFVEV